MATKELSGASGLVSGAVTGASLGAIGGPPGAAAGAIIGGLVGLATGLSAGKAEEEQSEAQRKAAQVQQRTREALSERGAGLQQEQLLLSARSTLQAAGIEQRQDELFTRLRGISLRQQQGIAAARQRTAAQEARIQGFGGSFTRLRTGETELKSSVERQLDLLDVEREARQEQRLFERSDLLKSLDISLRQNQLNLMANRAGIQIDRANTELRLSALETSRQAQLTGDIIGSVGDIAANQDVQNAIKKFFA